MAVALVGTGWWMYMDVPQTPNAVVLCVIIYNAAFGYRLGIHSLSYKMPSYISAVGDLFRGCTHPR